MPSLGKPVGGDERQLGTVGRGEDDIDGMASGRQCCGVKGNGDLGSGVDAEEDGRDAGIADPVEYALFSVRYNNLKSVVINLDSQSKRDISLYENFYR